MTYEERLKAFTELLENNIQDYDLRDVLAWCIDNRYFTAPASTKYHGNYPGGLFDHSYSVATYLINLTESEKLEWERSISPIIIGLFHDLCKVDLYCKDVDGYTYNNDTLLKGHGDKSIMILSTLMRLTEEEVMCIRYHMGAFTDKEEWGNYTRAINEFPNVLWTHHADMIATHIKGV